jgi:2-keto-4-pentenoate hydratase/2-oxohepta-3-ene-1,7-dioic acid hydratase in catechol pathway
VTTTDPGHREALLWDVPEIIRSILSPDSALAFDPEATRLEPGDVICLGTPGGVTFTSKSDRVVRLINALLFWKSPRDIHDVVARQREHFLLPGDRLFHWAEGLGFQLHTIAPLPGDG